MSTPFVLPQYQGSYYDLQRQQALAQALMQGALTQQQPAQAAAVGPYQVQARMSPIAPLSQLAQGLLAAKTGQQASQGLNNLGQQQWGSLVSMLGGGNGQSPQPSPDSAAVGGVGGSTVNPFAGSDGGDGSAGAGAGTPVSAAGPAGPNVGVGGGGSPLNPLGMNPGLAAYAMMQAPDKYFEAQMAAYKPAEIVSQIRAAGFDPNSPMGQALAKQLLAKNLAPDYVSGRPGGYMLNKSTGQLQWLPAVPAGGMPMLDANGQPTGGVVPQPGAADVTGQMAAAKAGGEGSMLPYAGVDVRGNPMPVTNRTAAATQGNGGLPLPLRNNNPGAVSPGGQVASYPDMQTGLQAMDKNLANYANDPKVRTLGDAITKWVGSPPNAPPYIKDVTSRLGMPASTPVDLTNPAQRQAISTAIMLHENGPGAVFRSSAGSGPGAAPAQNGAGPIYAAPPMGATPAANASQSAAPESMQKDWESMQPTRASAPSVLDSLDKMIALAKQKSPLMAGPLATNEIATALSPNAAEYEKQRANVITNLAGSGSTDAARALQGEAVPDYGKPTSAQLDGLQTQRNQVVTKQLRAQLLTGAYNAGDAKTYTTLASGFDQNVSPSMVPLLTMPAGAARAQALQQALKANPSLRPKLDWAVQNGILK